MAQVLRVLGQVVAVAAIQYAAACLRCTQPQQHRLAQHHLHSLHLVAARGLTALLASLSVRQQVRQRRRPAAAAEAQQWQPE